MDRHKVNTIDCGAGYYYHYYCNTITISKARNFWLDQSVREGHMSPALGHESTLLPV